MDSDVKEKFHRMLQEEDDLEGALRLLRESGYSKILSIKALTDTGRFDLAEAKELVHESLSWRDLRERDAGFQRAS